MKWEDECKTWHAHDLQGLRETGSAPFRLHVYQDSPDQPIIWTDPQGLSPEGRAMLHALNQGFRAKRPAAVLFSCDTWNARSNVFGERFGIPPGLPFEEHQRQYLRILNEQFGGSLANVPDDAKEEVLLTIIKGPKVAQFTQRTVYRRKQSRIILRETETNKGYHMLNLVPDWWDAIVQ